MQLGWRATAGGAATLIRISVAIIGGYGASIIAAAAVASWLPVPRDQAVLVGQMVSFLIYAILVLWTFAARTAARALIGIFAFAIVAGVSLLLKMWLGGPP